MTPAIIRLAVASAAAMSLVGAAAGATAQPVSSPAVAPVGEGQSGTGSSALDSGSAAARTAGVLVGNGDIIGIIVLLGVTPFQILTDGVCDMATLSALPSPCSPGPAHYTRTTPAQG
ncbi:hypothetical protein HGA13_00270 [Nocardia speluncae]|uniref:Uncharacterized protein n=1 Tax=Nocardia speluncae TaxID=419477 RepID=A0A846X5Y0_9NOCA|nr:hypothetical protein [Nocardia speluncae]NKY31511.1 hypothetical protein [Nocardia speluncae]